MDDAINNLYSAFAGYRIGDDFTGCECCVDPRDSGRLTATPLRELAFDDLERYSHKAVTTWGEVRHFKHFLPRILELSIEHRDDFFIDLAVVFGKLSYARFETWPQQEKDAVNRFFDEYWHNQLAKPIEKASDDSIDTVLCAIANALPSVQRFLDRWIETRTVNAKRHLAAFILLNAETLLLKGYLFNSFWDVSGRSHDEVLNWLQSDTLYHYFEGADDPVLVNDFSCTWPQLMAIRSALAAA
jgi:hypothetical protein